MLLLTGVGIGFVLGSRAGQRQYAELKVTARRIWESPTARRLLHRASGAVEEHAPTIARKAGAKAKDLSAQAAASARTNGKATLADAIHKVGDVTANAADHVGQTSAGSASQQRDLFGDGTKDEAAPDRAQPRAH